MNKVLVIDDEVDIGVMMKAMLKTSGRYVMCARSINEATLKLKDNKFETIFLDLNLDNEFGLNLIPTIRETNKDALVVVITAQKGIDINQVVNSSGVDRLLQKPFNKSQILNVLENGTA